MVIVPLDTNATLNHTILLTCFGFGIPLPDITWSMDGEALSNSSRIIFHNDLVTINEVIFVRSILELCNVAVTDEGIYSCDLRNTLGSSSDSFYLNVQG